MDNKNELAHQIDFDILRGIKKTPEEANLALNKIFEVNIPNSENPIDKILIASKSFSKQEFLTKAIRPFGITVLSPNEDEVIPEEEYQKVLLELNTPSVKYSPRLSARKLTQFLDAVKNGTPAIAFDSTVISGEGQLLEKPKSIDEARVLITKLTSKKSNTISVIDGVTFAMMQKNGEPFIWRSAAEIAVLLKVATQEEVGNYLEQQGEKVLDIAGGIDYASVLGKEFVDTTRQPSYTVGKHKAGSMQSLTDTVRSEQVNIFEGVNIADSASSILMPYFKGVPTHLVQGIIRNFSFEKRK